MYDKFSHLLTFSPSHFHTMLDLDNKELQKALQIIQYTRRSLFLTGKAGTGKSTFLRHICASTKKKHVVLAPTGIAAINAGGSTLHSFFKLPFHPLLPDDTRYSIRNLRKTMKYTSERCKMLREVELIIIDEISMVRADTIDFIDKVLRVYSRNMREPFGGKQLLLVGDVYQLEPVVKEDELRMLTPYYTSTYFFGAHVWRQMSLVSIELHKVYRQTDAKFISILDHIRSGTPTDADLHALNTRVGTPQNDSRNGLNITLSTLRNRVDYINEQRLAEIEGRSAVFTGNITGEFPASSLPTPAELELKEGAQVIFVKNDIDRRWVNGTLGVVENIDEAEGLIYVVTEDGEEQIVQRERWSNMRYRYNEKEKKIEEEEIGSYVQFPLRLAWAITVHKSQGLTFRRVNIDFTGGVFAGGQAYVALSRCTSLEGITLATPLRHSDIFVRDAIKRFAAGYNDDKTIKTALKESAADKEYAEAAQAFAQGDFDTCLDAFFRAIHHRYDIEKPAPRRLLRRKLGLINTLRADNRQLADELDRQRALLHRLAAEYTLMGKECEREHMPEAAAANYRKALELWPEANEPRERLEKLSL